MASSPNFAERLSAFASTHFTELRPGQKLVLDAYAADHLATADLAIEMPTGDGKTLLALLIADWALDQGRSVAYLTGTRQLAEHVEAEARRLGLEVVRFAGRDYGGAKLDDYHQASAVGVMTSLPRSTDRSTDGVGTSSGYGRRSVSGLTVRSADRVVRYRDPPLPSADHYE